MPAVVGDSIFAITQSAAFLSTGLSTNANGHTLNGNATANAALGSIPAGNGAATATFVPSNAVFEQGLCQLQQLMAKGLLNGTASLGNSPATGNAALPTANNNNNSNSNNNCSGNGAFLVSSVEAKKKEFAGVGQLVSRQSSNVERKRRPKSWKNCSSVVVSPQQVNDVNCSIGGNVVSAAPGAAASFAMYELTPSIVSTASNTTSAGGTTGVTNNLSVSISEHSLLSPTTTIMSPSDQRHNSRPFRPIAVKKDANGTPCQVAEITTSSLNNRSDHSPSSGTPSSKREGVQSPPATVGVVVTTSQLAQLSTSTQPTSVATSAITATSNGGIPVGIAVARQRYNSNSNCKTQTQNNKETIATSAAAAAAASSSYSSVVPYHQTLLEPSLFTSSISNIGVVAGAAGCEDRNGTNVGGGLPPPIIAWPTHTTGLPSQQQHAGQQWHPYTAGPVETQIQNLPSACAGYQLARDPVSGQIMLIPASQIGVMMPCDLSKSTSMNPTSATAAIGQQLISTNNSSFSLVQQFNSSNIHNSNINMPHHFSSISSSGSLLIQQISGNSGPPPLINHVNNSLVIAESAATQSVINSQSQYPPSNASYLINTQQISSENSTIIDPVQSSSCLISAGSQPSTYNQYPSVDNNLQTLKPSMMEISANPVTPVKRPETQSKSVDSEEVCSTRTPSEDFVVYKNTEEVVIMVDKNSSVQDASNQTDSMTSYQDEEDIADDDDDDEDEAVLQITEDEDDDKEIAQVEEKPDEKISDQENKGNCNENPDFSGLHLLLSGIERTEYRLDSVGVEEKPAKPELIKPKVKVESKYIDKGVDKPTPNGLEILCALADQRFQEENEGEESEESSSSDSSVKKRPHKNTRSLLHPYKREVDQEYQCYKLEQEAQRIPTSKYSTERLRSLSPNEAQIKMSRELAEIKKKYRETRKELSRLTHRKYTSSSSTTRSPTPCSFETPPIVNVEPDLSKVSTPVKRRPGRPRKHSDTLECIKTKSDVHHTPVKPMKRPKLKIESKTSLSLHDSEDDSKVPKLNNGDLSPPVLEPMCTSPKVKPFKSDILSPPTLIPSKKPFLGSRGLHDKEHKRSSEFENKPLFRLSSLDDSTDDDMDIILKPAPKFEPSHLHKPETMDMNESVPPVQKRKVGRPRKYPKEEIVSPVEAPAAKKPKLNVKPSLGGSTITNKHKEKRSLTSFSKNGEKQVPVTSSVVSTFAMLKSQRKSSDFSQDLDVECKPKITPKLKAEAKLKTWRQESPETCKDVLDVDYGLKKRKMNSDDSFLAHKDRKNIYDKRDKCHSKSKEYVSNLCSAQRIPSSTSAEFSNEDFRITSDLLDTIKKCPLRVLIAVGGLFRAGELSAVRPPDLYGIKLDGERGQRTHIYTKEEILKDVVLEVKGKYPLRNGTRVCAFWSSQYLSLYPGFVASLSSDESEDENYTAVEFDDGDSGRISMNDIRLLPKDFSINRHYESFNLPENSAKRKRRISSMSFEEIPVDKQLHSPESPTLCREILNSNDQDNQSPLTTSPSYDSSSRSSSNNEVTTSSRSDNFCKEEKKPSKTDVTEKEKNGDRKRLKKKRKDKFRESFDSSCKRKSHKHKSDSDEYNVKGHKRHKHKHKHHKHHKKRKSYAVEKEEYECKEKTDHNSNLKTIKMNSDSTFDVRKLCLEKSSTWGTVPHSAEHSSKTKQSSTITTSDNIAKVSEKSFSTSTTLKTEKKEFVEEEEEEEEEPVTIVNKEESNSSADSKKVVSNSRAILNEEDDEEICEKSKSFDIGSHDVVEEHNASKGKKEQEPITKIEKDDEDSEDVEKESDNEKTDVSVITQKEDQPTDDKELVSPVPSVVKEEGNEMKEVEKIDDSSLDSPSTTDSSDNKFWDWHGKGVKKVGKGRARKEFYRSIKRGDIVINLGDCAVFLTANSSAKPFIGRIDSMWESYKSMMVRVKWFYHPEETTGLVQELPYLGALFESPHDDKNDVQTISHKCDVLSLKEYRELVEKEPERLKKVYQSNDLYYLAGSYDPKTKRLNFEDGVLS